MRLIGQGECFVQLAGQLANQTQHIKQNQGSSTLLLDEEGGICADPIQSRRGCVSVPPPLNCHSIELRK